MIKKIGYVVAACIIFIAIMVAMSRLLTPIMNEHRADFETWASTLLEMPVTIKQVRVSWYQYQPEISLNEVTVLNKDTKDPILQIQKVRIFFSIPRSLWQWKLIPSGIMISGTDVNIYEKSTGEIALQGFPSLRGFNDQPYKSETKFIDVMGWLSQQPRLILNDIDLRYTSSNGIKRFLTLYNLRFENSNTHHVILGKALLHQELPTEATVTVQWQGDNTGDNAANIAFDKINANIYIFVSGLSLSQWFKNYVWHGWQLNRGMANAKIWAIWSGGTFQKIQCAFESYGLDLYSATDKSTHKINRLSGNAGWKREGKNQIFAGDDIFIDFPSHLWPSTSFYLTLIPDAAGKLSPSAINVGYVDLADAQTFLFSSPPLLSDSTRRLLSELNLKGDIQSISAIFSSTLTDWIHISLNANISQLSVLPWHHFPGVKNLSGIIKWNGTQGDLSLHSNQTVFQYGPIFSNAIPIDQLSGNILWQLDQHNNWLVHLQSLQAFNSDAAINVNGLLTIPPVGSLSTDLNANFTMQRINHVTRYLPMHLFDPGLREWLKNAFVSGVIQSGNMILRGQLNDFPFDKSLSNKDVGQFQIAATTKNLNLHFAPDWPSLKNLSAKVIFAGRQIIIDADHAEIEGIPVTQVHGLIPYLGNAESPVLQIQTGNIEADFAQGLNFVRASPLEKTIGKMFADTKVTGPMELTLGLTVPLANPDKTTVRGDITFKDTQLNLVPWNLAINKLHGSLQFTEQTTEANNIQGELFNKPLQLNLKTIQKTKNISVVQASVLNHLDITDIENWLKVPFSQVVKGSTDITAKINFSLKTPIEVHLQSNLLGVTVNLPAQYAKKPEEARDFSADLIIQEKQPLRMKMSYSNLLGAALILDHKKDKFILSGADLRLGGGLAAWPPTSGLYITGNLDQFDWDKIKMYYQSGTVSNLVLRGIDVQINALSLPGQELSQAHVQIIPLENYWDVSVDSKEVNGQIQVPVKFTPQSVITAQFQKLNLVSLPTTRPIEKINIKTLPSISFTANNVTYNDMPLGQVSFKTSPSGNGLAIRTLTILSPRVELNAEGNWISSGSRLHGTAASSNVTQLLSSLRFDVHNIVSSKGRLDFDLTWHAAPYALTLASMNGHASLDLGQGRIVELSQTSGAKMDLGRMLSIFSLQTIPRRLSLDFSDVFQKGYSFDSFRGDFKFENGNAYTNNTHFDGPVARVDIYGRIGLAAKDYDFTLSVTPYVTSSIPVAATLITGQPVIGLAAWAVDKVISSGVSKATTYYYAVRGPWSNPSWDSISVPKNRT